ncbi:hypothetical protein [Hydrogenimonas sp. SS33]|uniref:hypothetical protein n=1 Tax=Hydrogenimonas leucolamina TaxID=2954236 RepID=UPI00336C1F3F
MKKLFVFFIASLFLASAMNGSVFKGQRAYMKLCKKCHKSGGKLSQSHTQEEWEDYFDDNAKLLLDAHKNNMDAMEKLQSKRFKKNIRNLRQFFVKYASDSGNVPACN